MSSSALSTSTWHSLVMHHCRSLANMTRFHFSAVFRMVYCSDRQRLMRSLMQARDLQSPATPNLLARVVLLLGAMSSTSKPLLPLSRPKLPLQSLKRTIKRQSRRPRLVALLRIHRLLPLLNAARRLMLSPRSPLPLPPRLWCRCCYPGGRRGGCTNGQPLQLRLLTRRVPVSPPFPALLLQLSPLPSLPRRLRPLHRR